MASPAGEASGHFPGIGGLIDPMFSLFGLWQPGRGKKQRERDVREHPSRAASSARMSPTGLSLSMVACLQCRFRFTRSRCPAQRSGAFLLLAFPVSANLTMGQVAVILLDPRVSDIGRLPGG